VEQAGAEHLLDARFWQTHPGSAGKLPAPEALDFLAALPKILPGEARRPL
jgi:hypothetical protein